MDVTETKKSAANEEINLNNPLVFDYLFGVCLMCVSVFFMLYLSTNDFCTSRECISLLLYMWISFLNKTSTHSK